MESHASCPPPLFESEVLLALRDGNDLGLSWLTGESTTLLSNGCAHNRDRAVLRATSFQDPQEALASPSLSPEYA